MALAVPAGVVFWEEVLAYDPIRLGNTSYGVSPGAGNAEVSLPDYRAMLIPARPGKEFQVKWNIVNSGDSR